ncbi:hypothetical protein [Haloferax sp. DFSO60]|uniref:DUF7287 family protein n=1 Tax=Haloferax sp. DFSO60 TaxID=3388652 RepID=UPI00397DFC2D
MCRSQHSRTGRSNRAQTTIDFAIGIGLFLITVAWIVGTVPQILQPFDASQEQPLVANRAADSLTKDLLTEDRESSILNETCTMAFFDGDPPGDCHYGDPDPHTATGLSNSYGLNITLSKQGTTLAETGEAVPSSTTIVSARRAVYFDGELHKLSVKVW